MAIDTLAPADLSNLVNKSVFITGGASGLGLHAATFFARSGAYVTIADVQDGSEISAELVKEGCHVQFVHCDVTSWDSQLNAFQAALNFSPFKTLDTVAAYAGVDDSGHLVDHINATPASVDGPPPTAPSVNPLEVNTKGMFYTATLALHYFRLKAQNVSAATATSKSLIIVSSLAGYVDDTHDSIYTASKFGSRGIFRAIRARAQQELNVRVNLVAPWAMKTAMTAPILAQMEAFGIQEGKGITFVEYDVLTGAVARLAVDESIHGKSISK